MNLITRTCELHITYRCNIMCDNCSNLCSQAPAKLDLSPLEINAFIDDLKSHGNPWRQITVHGGEPAMHPKWLTIANILNDYRKSHGVTIWWLTNDSEMWIRDRTAAIAEMGIALGIARKLKGAIMYIPVNESPTDAGIEFEDCCFQATSCGMAYNNLGYWPCSPMASAARVFGYKSLGKSASELTAEASGEKMKEHCKHCGFAMPNRRRVDYQLTTPTWERALMAYNVMKDNAE